MAKNEIKMLLLGAGESGKVRFSKQTFGSATFNLALTVNGAKANEAHSSRRLQGDRTRFLQRNYFFQHHPVDAVSILPLFKAHFISLPFPCPIPALVPCLESRC